MAPERAPVLYDDALRSFRVLFFRKTVLSFILKRLSQQRVTARGIDDRIG